MGWNEDLQNENIDLFTVIGEAVYDPTDDELYVQYTAEDEFLDDLYASEWDVDYDLSDQEYDDWADRDAFMTDDWDQD